MRNVKTEKTERIGWLLMMHANSREEIEECYAGDICAGDGLKQTSTGDTLAAPDSAMMLENIEFPAPADPPPARTPRRMHENIKSPEPVIAVAIEPKTKADQEKMGTALQRLGEGGPALPVESDEGNGQTRSPRGGG